MRYVPTEKLELGMLIASPITDNRGRILINGYTELSEKYLQRIKVLGLPGIYVEDTCSADVTIKDIISPNLRNLGAKAVREQDVELCIKVSKNIVNEILTSSDWDCGMVDIRSFDEYLYRHSVQVAVLSTLIGVGLGLSDKELVELCLAGLLHDMGMTCVAKDVSTTDVALSYLDVKNIKLHPRISVRMIEDYLAIPMTTRMGIMQHHENLDGSGYPEGKCGDKIHPFAKIIHVADTYDALISKRPYRKPYTYMEAVEYLMGRCDSHFDREVVQQFVQKIPVYPKGFPVLLSDGREGFVVSNRKGAPLRPVVRLFDGEEVDLSHIVENRNITICSVLETEEHFI